MRLETGKWVLLAKWVLHHWIPSWFLSSRKEIKLVCTISVALNISLCCFSQMWGYDTRGEKEMCETENEEKSPPVSTNGSALGWRGQERMTDKGSSRVERQIWTRGKRREWFFSKGKKRLRSDLDTKIIPILSPICWVRRGNETKTSLGLLQNSSKVLSPRKEAHQETQGCCAAPRVSWSLPGYWVRFRGSKPVHCVSPFLSSSQHQVKANRQRMVCVEPRVTVLAACKWEAFTQCCLNSSTSAPTVLRIWPPQLFSCALPLPWEGSGSCCCPFQNKGV